MRKVSGVLMAAALLLPATFIVAAPAGAAGGLTCSKLTGTATFTPPVPKTTPGKSNILLKANFASCTGTPGVTGGAVTLPLYKGTTKQTCTSLALKPTKIVVAKGGSVKWNKGAKSTLGADTITPAGLATYKSVAKVTAGQFVGKTITLTATFTPNGCPIKSAKLALKAKTKITVK